MEKILIDGGQELHGEIPISGAKNAALPLMIAAMLTPKKVTLRNVPRVSDVRFLVKILQNHGVAANYGNDDATGAGQVEIEARNITNVHAPYELVSKMRASFWVIGPLLARCGEAEVSLPGGCTLGTRPVDLYLEGIKAMGAEAEVQNGYVKARCPNGLSGADIDLPIASVGTTITLMMAGTLANGVTVIRNAAREPEIVDVANLLNEMGARVANADSGTITITGVTELGGADHEAIPDRLEIGSYLIATMATGGNVLLRGAQSNHLTAVLSQLRTNGAEIEAHEHDIRVKFAKSKIGSRTIKSSDISTSYYPNFPTDLQAPYMALTSLGDGVSAIEENIFENRFMHVQELARFGADIKISGRSALVTGVDSLSGAEVMATDIRGGMAVLIAALAANGRSVINRVYHLRRGYERIEEKLGAVGAKIWSQD